MAKPVSRCEREFTALLFTGSSHPLPLQSWSWLVLAGLGKLAAQHLGQQSASLVIDDCLGVWCVCV